MGILDKLDYDAEVEDRKAYEKELGELQLAILKAELKTRESGRAVIVAFEGWDAAGKGGAIKRMTEKLDPRGFSVHAVGAPSEDEKKHHYLWRFWTRMPERGRWGVFDRTWYGRVLVERVEGFCKKKAWKRAYREINEFERALIDDGAVLVKVFLAITKPEQKRRFEERENDPYKRWKIGPDDWRNREHWDEYVDAAEQMFDETNSPYAPWKIIGGNRKWNARLEVLRHLIARLDAATKDDD